jgi:hypothetical protein
MAYVIRDEAGVMKAEVTDRIAKNIFAEINGHWTTDSKGRRCYNIDVDSSYTATGHECRIYLWEGDYLYASA